MVKSLTTLLVILTTSCLQAQALAVRTTEIQCTPQGCRQLIGTGACAFIGNIADRSIYITAAHNINQARTIQIGYGGSWWNAQVVFKEYKGTVDYAILETRKIPAPHCFELSNKQPADGIQAVAYGYSNGIYQLKSLRARILVTPQGRYFSRIVAKGDSGGPILVNGQVVGIIKGHNFSNTIYTESTLIRHKLINLYGRLPCCDCEPSAIVKTHPVPSQQPENENRQQIAAIETEISRLQKEIERLKQTQIPVQLIGADGTVKQEQKYLLGQPIKLRFKAVNK
ncbi:hypothetical protein Pan153_60510 [Gimesia panareensis]|uniref:Trypsin n=1 Tax=Gimesia panareensis TaxID=2527978 RepID=A0A518FYB7_9PLAN|nr:trypsin-like peptidase domain-containing protein [Gimesia panareensis]QDV21363.1 hypothetical protein Pan153_60510 [Gimesia panareensis]